LRQTGLRLHETHRRNFELQYRNNQLIESLTRQTQAALDALEIKNRLLASAARGRKSRRGVGGGLCAPPASRPRLWGCTPIGGAASRSWCTRSHPRSWS